MILVVDNYDSFVANLARYLRLAGADVVVVRNDEADAATLLALRPAGVVLSPGPKAPKDAGVCLPLLAALDASTPLLGVCLGHQCLVERYGGATRRARHPAHGEASDIRHDGEGLFRGLPDPFRAGRYHSLVADPPAGSGLVACAWSPDGETMGARAVDRPWFGVQFHPESLLTPDGRAMIAAFVDLTRRGLRS